MEEPGIPGRSGIGFIKKDQYCFFEPLYFKRFFYFKEVFFPLRERKINSIRHAKAPGENC